MLLLVYDGMRKHARSAFWLVYYTRNLNKLFSLYGFSSSFDTKASLICSRIADRLAVWKILNKYFKFAVYLEGDCLVVVYLASWCCFYETIMILLHEFFVLDFNYVPREGNDITHHLS